MIREGKEQTFIEFLNFMKLANVKGIIVNYDIKDDERVKVSDLFNKELLYWNFCVNVITAIAFCHENQLSIEKNLDFKLIVFNVNIFW